MLKILIVDDEPQQIMVFKMFLQKTDHQVKFLESSDTTVELAEMFQPDLVFLDIEMPDINGLELLKELKANDKTKNIPIIMLTGHTDRHYSDRAMELGAEGFLSKPLERSHLMAKLDAFEASK